MDFNRIASFGGESEEGATRLVRSEGEAHNGRLPVTLRHQCAHIDPQFVRCLQCVQAVGSRDDRLVAAQWASLDVDCACTIGMDVKHARLFLFQVDRLTVH